jgi:glycosyltransferase involved in cell wall biosynthesis
VRVLYLHQYFTTPSMSGGTRSYEIARRLVAKGHEVHMIASARDDGQPRRTQWYETDEAGIRVHWLPVPYSNRMSYRDRIEAFFRFAWHAAHEAARLGGDLVYATSTPLTIALPAVYAARRHRIPMVFEVRDLWPEMPIAVGALKNPIAIGLARRLERFAYRNAAHVIALSPGMKAGVVATGYPASRVTVIPNSCDMQFFDVDPAHGRAIRARYDWLGERPLVVYVGTIGLVNGVTYLARLAAEVGKTGPDVRFVVVGDGRERERVRQEAETLGVLDKSLFLLPAAPKVEMPSWLSAADVATSLFIDLEPMWVNSANKFFDALAAGRPVAINYGGWQADLVREAGAGLVLDRHDVRAAASQLLNVIRDGRWLERAGAAARQLARSRFDRDELTTDLEALLVRVARGPRATLATPVAPPPTTGGSDPSKSRVSSAV